MALNHGQVMEQIKRAAENTDTLEGREEFLYNFLHALDRPKNTITKLRKNDPTTNVSKIPGTTMVRQSFFFEPVNDDQDVHDVLDQRIADTKVIAGKKDDPRIVIVTNFDELAAWDIRKQERLETRFAEIDRHYGFFLPIYGRGYEQVEDFKDLEADVKAARKLGQLFDEIRDTNAIETSEDVHRLNVFLTRLLFCFFAEDTGIFQKNQFTKLVANHTDKEGSNVSEVIRSAFSVMNLPENSLARREMPKHLDDLPYVNRGLFQGGESAPPLFTAKARRILIDCGSLDWHEINPDIFGSMFQSVVEEEQRSNLGQHYTSVPNIMKVIAPLFLDPLRDNLDAALGNKKKLEALLTRIHKIKIFDPACGSGNFLIIAYKELRRIEMDVLEALQEARGDKAEGSFDSIMVGTSGIRLSQFYGIEIHDFAHEVAMLSLWIAEHQANQVFRERFGDVIPPLPLKVGGNIVCDNALRIDWNEVCYRGKDDEVYLIGNPPFHGYQGRSLTQNEDMEKVFSGFKSHGKMDYVTSWFWKGAQYIQGTNTELAFVSTNSINQGIQVGMLWPPILELGVKIRFAYQGFKWKNNARDQAGVHVSVIGLTTEANSKRRLFTWSTGTLQELNPPNINPYLLNAGDVAISARRVPLMEARKMQVGSMADDGGNLILTTEAKNHLISEQPQAEKWFKRLMGADEFINGRERWCLWLANASKEEINSIPPIRERVEKVRAKRLNGSRPQFARTPHLFSQITHSDDDFILVPSVTSERREYSPIGFFSSEEVGLAPNLIIPNGTPYDFGILQTRMHMLWLKTVAGRLKSDFRYSNTLVYNTFPWPTSTDSQRKEIEEKAQEVLDTRELYPTSTMADLYDPDKMPDDLREAHRELDEAVERTYRSTPFRNDNERLEYLFKRYETLIDKEKRT
ncbi:MAG: class I SAM-dependent DNA methyltransferase [Halomonas sp.]|nr:DNA methyltransferase [Halomonas sp.]MBR2513194.1 class I SAM-dependent DNA methyltransferase [Halomonas sp.]